MELFGQNKKRISMRNNIILLFLVIMTSTVGIISYIVFSSWLATAKEAVIKQTEDINNEIFNQVDQFINIPIHMDEMNQLFIENGIVNMEDKKEREKFFVEVLKTHPEFVYSFSIGTENGEYYGARRNGNNEIEIMMNNQDTFGESWYYSVNENMTAGDFSLNAGKFDPRTRDWYISAKDAQKLIFSPIYKHFVMNELAISVSAPIYSQDHTLHGVLGTHITISNIDNYLKDIVKASKSWAIIVEKNTGELVANSFNAANYTLLSDGSIKRVKISEIDNKVIQTLYKTYLKSNKDAEKVNYSKKPINITVKEYNQEGLEWLVISGIPESLYLKNVNDNMKLVVIFTVVALIIAILIYYLSTNRLFKPINSLIEITNQFSQGDLLQRVPVFRNDEIGRLSNSFNHLADTINVLVCDLETKVKIRTKELETMNTILAENKDQLKLILDSTVEAIYGCDLAGNCTFCNASCLRLLGYQKQEDLIGKNMHFQFHHSKKDGTPIPIEECEILKLLKEGKGAHSKNDIFWKSDGTYLEAEYFAYPQYKNGNIIGAVVTFMEHS